MAVAAAGPHRSCMLNVPGGAAASAQLVPQIVHALTEARLALRDLAAISFGRGPGAFTGLRTSCAVAQGLGFGLGRPLLPIDSLLVVAEDALGPASPEGPPARVAVAMDARMDEIYGAIYERAGVAWHALLPPALFTLAAWNARLESEAAALRCVAGSALAAFGPRLHRPAGAGTVPHETDRAAALMRLARRAWAKGVAMDAADALPLYLRDKVALTTAERVAARAAGTTA
ncbi:MAG: tRNA (adenosine(37)-N6)-threonylcarbamoyltransferase complex dimerization subunit type 1 TsaB [Rubrivivax sp.]|nr:tRNA (adenosine(37)-N6)-threonylcarbamoyltransferase complex dimerization subunit type 1 TsaB [Rubrivivax sp.]